MANVKVIDTKKELPKSIKIAAYARVSSDKDSMLHSLSSQVSYFSKLIQANDSWVYVGVYSDEAKTGTKDTRAAFQRLIQDAKEGRIDIIITKSVSRFARNTLTLLETVRMLKEIEVDVYFQEQNIHTNSNEGEFLLSILASYAQEESRSCSENTLWRVRKNFEEGKLYGGNDSWGYKIVDGKLILVPEEAKLVKRVFELYIAGNGDAKIAQILNDDNIKSRKGKLWTKATIRGILTNPNYTGDLVLQKTYRENHITKKSKINNGEKPKFINEKDHDAIIDETTFKTVQTLRKERLNKGSKEAGHHYFSGLLVCEHCGKKYKFKNTKYHVKYECTTYNDLGKKYCPSKGVPEETLITIANEIMHTTIFDEEGFRKLVNYIVVKDNNILDFNFNDGTSKEIHWSDRSRRESWTPEMREIARQRNYERSKKHGS